MSVRYSKYLPAIAVSGDFIILNLIFVVGYCLRSGGAQCLQPTYVLFYLYLNVTWLILSIIFKAGTINQATTLKKILFTYIKITIFFFILFLLYFQLSSFNYYPRHYIKYIFPLLFGAIVIWKFSLHYAFVVYRKMGYNFRKVIIVGLTKNTNDLKSYFIDNSFNGYKFLGFIDKAKNPKKDIIGSWHELKEIVELHEIDEIYIGWEGIPKEIVPHITSMVHQYPLKVRIVPNFGEFSYKNAELVNYDMVPVLQIHPGPLSYWYNRFVKRSFDIAFSLFIILGFLSWISILLSLCSFFGSREGLFFVQKRTGADDKVFSCLKFRTMRTNPDADEIQATRKDKRITPVGRVLRNTSLDELPQFVNVLLGQMSTVGPRPHMLRHTKQYRKLVKRFMMRHTVKPGITGLAQVRGFRGEIRRTSDIKQRFTFDLSYIENWNFGMDIKIIFLTVLNLIKGDKKAY